MLEAIIFDLDDTLYDYSAWNKKAVEELCLFVHRQINISQTSFYEAFHWSRREIKRLLGSTGSSHNRLLYCQKTLEYLGYPPATLALDMYEVYWGYMLQHMSLRDGVWELLDYCKKKKMKIGICTDLTAHIQHRKIRKLGLSEWIDEIVTSEEAGAEKPNEKIYQMILKKLKTSPENTIFVGDDLEKDVKGPIKAGMKAIWFHSEKQEPYHTCSSFVEVKEFFNGWE